MKKIRLIGVYDYTVVLTYISLVITLVGISLAIEGSFRSAVDVYKRQVYMSIARQDLPMVENLVWVQKLEFRRRNCMREDRWDCGK